MVEKSGIQKITKTPSPNDLCGAIVEKLPAWASLGLGQHDHHRQWPELWTFSSGLWLQSQARAASATVAAAAGEMDVGKGFFFFCFCARDGWVWSFSRFWKRNSQQGARDRYCPAEDQVIVNLLKPVNVSGRTKRSFCGSRSFSFAWCFLLLPPNYEKGILKETGFLFFLDFRLRQLPDCLERGSEDVSDYHLSTLHITKCVV